MLLFLVFIIIYKLPCVPVPEWSKVLELVADISIKGVGCIKLQWIKNYLLLIFFLYVFVNLWHFSHKIVFIFLSGDGLIFFCFFFFFCCMGALGLLLLRLKSKMQKGSDSLPSLIENYQMSYTVHNFRVNSCKLQDWTRESLTMVLSMED